MLDRRGFLKFVGGVGVGILATPIPWKGTDDAAIWTQNWSWVPSPAKGEPGYVSTISKMCPSGQGIRVRMLGDRPVTVHGDPEHPLSKGGMNALAAAEVQLLHSPARLRQPQKRGGNGAYEPVSWEEAYKLLAEGLKKAAPKGIYTLSGDPTSAVNEVLSVLSGKSGGRSFIAPGEEHAARAAWKAACGFGAADRVGMDIGRLGYDIERSDMVLAIGAGVLESWGTVVSNRKAWAAGHPTGKEPSFRLAYAGPVQDNTATGADWWLPSRPGQELAVALGIARLLRREFRGPDLADSEAFARLLDGWTPARVEDATGVPAQMLEEVATALVKARRPLVIAGSPLNQGGGAAPVLAAVACNIMLGALNSDGGLRILPHFPTVLSGASSLDAQLDNDFMAYTQALAKGGDAPGAFLFYDANPVYSLPGGAVPVFEKAGFTAAFASFMDETTAQCDLILPAAMGLERYDDAECPYGVGEVIYSLAVPVAAPQYEARPAGDVLLAQARDLGYVGGGIQEMVDVLKLRASRLSADWTGLSNGVPYVSRQLLNRNLQPESTYYGADILAAAAETLPTSDALGLAPIVRRGVGTAETGIPPYGVKLVGPRDVYKKNSVVYMNSATAAKYGVAVGDAVTLTGPGGSCTGLLLIDEAVSTGSVSMLAGMGHTAFDAFSQNKGSNLLQLAAPTAEAGTGLTVWSAITVTVAKA